jgi:dolichyl-phosphate beta-glucosyltransferase
VFARLVNVVVGTRIADTQCGFKLFRADVAMSLFADVVCAGWAFDVEVLALAERRGFRVAEIPVSWHEAPGSKVRVLWDGPRMLFALWGIRRRCGALASTAADGASIVLPANRRPNEKTG